jgi:hypothetical protein
MIECYRYVHLTHRNLYPTIMSISIFDELNNQCFMTARTTFLTSSPQTITEESIVLFFR